MKILKTSLLVLFAFFIANISQVSAATVTGSVTVTVTPTVTSYTITASGDTGCIVSPSGSIPVSSGGSLTLSLSANSGYTISSMTTDGIATSLVTPSVTFSNVTTNHTFSTHCVPVAVDSCGLGSGSTPQNPEPTGISACANGVLNSSSPIDTLLAWNWSCGTVKTCSAPKYGCTTKYDINYNASGPSNTYGCANKCSVSADTNYNTAPCSQICTNGGTNWPTCTQPSSNTITAYDCAISAGSSGCQTSVSWNIANPVGVTKVTFYVGNILSTSSSGSDGTYTSKGNITYYLYNNGSIVGSSTATASCTPGTSWDSVTSKCKSLSSLPDLVIYNTNTSSWNIKVGDSVGYFGDIQNIGNTKASNFTALFQTATNVDALGNATGISDFPVAGYTAPALYYVRVDGRVVFNTAGTNYVRICADKSSAGDTVGVIAEYDETNNCSPWRSQTVLNPPPSNTISSTDCTIQDGSNTCFTNVSWNIVDSGLVDPKVNTTNCSTVTVAYGSSGNINYSIPKGTTTFYACDGTTALKNTTATASCGNASTWNGTYCISNNPAPIISSFTADKYSIDFGKAVILTWTSTGSTSCSITATATSVVTPSLPASSNKSFKPTKTTNYTLSCTGPGGTATQTLPNPIVVGKINPSYQEY